MEAIILVAQFVAPVMTIVGAFYVFRGEEWQNSTIAWGIAIFCLYLILFTK